MDSAFWSNTKERLTNPTFVSKHVIVSMNSYKPSLYSSPSEIHQENQSRIVRSQSQILISNRSENPQKSQSSNFPSISSQQQLKKQNSVFLSQGKRSLTDLIKNDKDVFHKQNREENIITQVPREYKDTIKVFPKYRLENYHSEYFKRQAFLKGNPELARRSINANTVDKIIEIKMKKSNDSNIFGKNSYQF